MADACIPYRDLGFLQATVERGDFRNVLNGTMAHLFLWSPPYNIGSKGPRNDKMRGKEQKYSSKAFRAITDYPDDLPEEKYQKQQADALIGWPTPQARDWKGPQGRAYKSEAIDLPMAAILASGLTLDEYKPTIHGVLNVELSRWLQGFPSIWSSCAAMVML